MVLGDEPGPVGEDLVDLVEVAQFRRDAVQALQPALVAALRHKLGHLLFDQVRALVPAGGLQKQKKKKKSVDMSGRQSGSTARHSSQHPNADSR